MTIAEERREEAVEAGRIRASSAGMCGRLRQASGRRNGASVMRIIIFKHKL